MHGMQPCRSAGPGEATGNDPVAEAAATMEVGGTGASVRRSLPGERGGARTTAPNDRLPQNMMVTVGARRRSFRRFRNRGRPDAGRNGGSPTTPIPRPIPRSASTSPHPALSARRPAPLPREVVNPRHQSGGRSHCQRQWSIQLAYPPEMTEDAPHGLLRRTGCPQVPLSRPDWCVQILSHPLRREIQATGAYVSGAQSPVTARQAHGSCEW